MFTILGADGKPYGPVPADKIREWIAGGRANLETRALRAGDAEWKTLGDFPEFVPVAEPPPAAPGPFIAPPLPVVTATALEGSETELADRSTRLAAFLVDYIIAVLAALPGLIMLGAPFLRMMLTAMRNGTEPDLSEEEVLKFVGGMVVLGLGSLALLIVQVVMLSTRGQTIAKRILNIRVIRHADERPAGFVHAWLLRNFVVGIIQAIPTVGFIFFIVDSCFIFGGEQRCLHDLIAGTKVIKVKLNNQASE